MRGYDRRVGWYADEGVVEYYGTYLRPLWVNASSGFSYPTSDHKRRRATAVRWYSIHGTRAAKGAPEKTNLDTKQNDMFSCFTLTPLPTGVRLRRNTQFR